MQNGSAAIRAPDLDQYSVPRGATIPNVLLRRFEAVYGQFTFLRQKE